MWEGMVKQKKSLLYSFQQLVQECLGSLFHKLELSLGKLSHFVPFNIPTSLIFYCDYAFAARNILLFGFANNFPSIIFFQSINLHFHDIFPFFLCQSLSIMLGTTIEFKLTVHLLWLTDNLCRGQKVCCVVSSTFLMAMRRSMSFREFKVFPSSGSSLSIVLGSKLGLNS